MIIYKLVVNEVDPDPMVCVGSYKAPRTLKSEEFFLNKESALKKQNEIYDGLQKLLGYIPRIEARIQEVQVSEV